MKLLAVLLVVSMSSGSMAGMMGLTMEMKDMMNTYNLYATCLGPEFAAGYMMNIQKACEACMAEDIPESLITELSNNLLSDDDKISLAKLIRGRRQVDNGLSEEKINEITGQVTEHKGEMMSTLGNFSCVLAQMGIFTADGEVNMEQFTFDAAKEFLSSSAIADDDDALRAMSTGVQDCNEVATAWPEATLRDPLMKAFGRRHVFLKCMLKVQDGVCYKRQLYIGMKTFQKLDTAEVDLGIPGDKFDKAAGAWQVMMHNWGPEMKMVNDFFWRRMGM